MAQMGRIGGPLLADNLLRNGTDLAFDTQVLYLDVTNKRIGFNNSAPVSDLYAPNAIDSVNLIADNTANIQNFVLSGSTIQQLLTNITISPNQSVNPTISTSGLSTNNLYIYGNTISDTVTNDNINITPKELGQIFSVVINVDPTPVVGQILTVIQGTATGGSVSFPSGSAGEAGTVVTGGTGYVTGAAQAKDLSNNLYSITITVPAVTSINFANGNGNVQVTVTGALHAQGNITFDGNITLGNSPTNTITIAAELNSNLLPVTTNLYNLGSNSLNWANIYVNNYSSNTLGTTASTNLIATTFNLGNITLNSNTITDTTADITFSTSGTGALKFNNNYYFNTPNTLTFPSANVVINSTSNGYIKFSGNGAVVFPAGTSSNYPASPVQGQLRYNSTLNYSEVYNGTSWNPVGGTSAVLTQSQVNDTMWAWDLILG